MAERCVPCQFGGCDHCRQGQCGCDHGDMTDRPCEVIFTCSDVENGAHYRRCAFNAGHDGGHMVGEFVGVPYKKTRVRL